MKYLRGRRIRGGNAFSCGQSQTEIVPSAIILRYALGETPSRFRNDRVKFSGWYCQLNCPLSVESPDGYIQTTPIPKRKHRGYGDTFFIDEVFVKINGKQHYLWRAVDQDGEVVDVCLQARRDGATAKRFFKRLLRSHGGEPRKIVTDKLRSYGVAHREMMPDVIHDTTQYANNRAEQSHEATRVRERGMHKFKSAGQARQFLTAHAAIQNLFNLGRHLVGAGHYRSLRVSAFSEWSRAVA